MRKEKKNFERSICKIKPFSKCGYVYKKLYAMKSRGILKRKNPHPEVEKNPS